MGIHGVGAEQTQACLGAHTLEDRQEEKTAKQGNAEENERRKGVWSPVVECDLHLNGTPEDGSLRGPL